MLLLLRPLLLLNIVVPIHIPDAYGYCCFYPDPVAIIVPIYSFFLFLFLSLCTAASGERKRTKTAASGKRNRRSVWVTFTSTCTVQYSTVRHITARHSTVQFSSSCRCISHLLHQPATCVLFLRGLYLLPANSSAHSTEPETTPKKWALRHQSQVQHASNHA